MSKAEQLERLKGLSPEKRARLLKALQQDAAIDSKAHTIPRRKHTGLIPQSFAQKRLWFIDQLEPGVPLYNVPRSVRIKGNLSIEVLQQSLVGVMARHESLRTCFASGGGQPTQVIRDEVELN